MKYKWEKLGNDWEFDVGDYSILIETDKYSNGWYNYFVTNDTTRTDIFNGQCRTLQSAQEESLNTLKRYVALKYNKLKLLYEKL